MPNSPIEFTSELIGMRSVFKEGNTHEVPFHQRDYAWDQEKVIQLWDDIQNTRNSGKNQYFIGTIVVKQNSNEKKRIIIDGQQRIVALSIFFSAIRSIYHENNDDRENDIFKEYIARKDMRSRVSIPYVTLNEVNNQHFQDSIVNYLSDTALETELARLRKTSTNHKLLSSFSEIRKLLHKECDKSHNYINYLIEIENYISDNVKFIMVTVADESDAFLIFETLNDRGADLAPIDLLKNYIFGHAGQHLQDIRRYWQEMMTLLGDQYQTQFLRHYWLSKYGIVRERDLYKELKNKYHTHTSILALMKDLRKAVDNYIALSNSGHTYWKDYSSESQDFIDTLNLFKVTQFKSLLLSAMDILSIKEIEKLLKGILVISMRYTVICSMNPNIIELEYSKAAIQIRSKKMVKAKKILDSLAKIYPDDKTFKNSFLTKEITRPKHARYILNALANNIQGSKILKIITDEKIVTLEHILPKTPNQYWLKVAIGEEQYNNYVYRLGNMTLIEKEYNKHIGSKPFEEKKEKAFNLSKIKMSKDLCSHSIWNPTTIEENQKAMAELAARIWLL